MNLSFYTLFIDIRNNGSLLRLKPNTIQIYRCLSNGFKILPGCYWSSNYKEISWGKWLISLTTDVKTGIKR